MHLVFSIPANGLSMQDSKAMNKQAKPFMFYHEEFETAAF
jgi:hypothetical protein